MYTPDVACIESGVEGTKPIYSVHYYYDLKKMYMKRLVTY